MLARPLCRHLPAGHVINGTHSRSSATLARSNFTSFFFNNDQWSTRRATLRISSNATVANLVDARGFKAIEELTPRRLLRIYAQLSKSRLTALNVLTAMTGVALSPLPTTVPILLATAIGTALCSASANTLNQVQEVPYDAQMARTRMRPLVRRAISPAHAMGFAAMTGIAGPAILWTQVNPTTAILGLGTIITYAGLYTWLKRRSVINTWVGAVVGAMPPLMGWTAGGGQLWPSSSQPIALYLPEWMDASPAISASVDNPLATLAFFIFLYSWQFPHFNAFSHFVRDSYAQAGYRMLSVISPRRNAAVSLRHALILIPTCSILVPLAGLTTWAFAITSLAPNFIFSQAAWRFWKAGGEKEARVLFRHSLWYLPVVLGLMMFHKSGANWTGWIEEQLAPFKGTSANC